MMEAKDTVMNIGELDDYNKAASYLIGEALTHPDGFNLRAIKTLMDSKDLSFKAGIKEVVEWIDNLIIGIEEGCIVLDMNENQWKVQKKEWGIVGEGDASKENQQIAENMKSYWTNKADGAE